MSKHNCLVIKKEDLDYNPDREDEKMFFALASINLVIVVPIKMNGEVTGIIGVIGPKQNTENHSFLKNIAFFVYDAIQKHLLHDQLVSLSKTDELTGLPNRYCYDQALEAMRGEISRNVGVLFADLNGLKYINDHFGHRSGDQYLKAFAQTFFSSFGPNNVFRISGDEFVVIEKGISQSSFDEQVKTFGEDVLIKGFEVTSFGSVYYKQCSNPLRLINEAEAIMYDRKKAFHAGRPPMSDEEKEDYYRKRFPFLPH